MRLRVAAPALTLAFLVWGGAVWAAPAPRVVNQMTSTSRCAAAARSVFASRRSAIARWARTAWLGRQAGVTAAVSDNVGYNCKVQMAETDLQSRLSPARLTLAQDRLVLASLGRLLTAYAARPGQFLNVTLWAGGGQTMSCIGLSLAPTPDGEYARVLAGADCQPVLQIAVRAHSAASFARAVRALQGKRAAGAVHRAWRR